MRIGGNANVGIIKVSSDPDGTLTAPRGTEAIDTTTGITWKNRNGGTRWDPVIIPPMWGVQNRIEFDGDAFTSVNIASGTGTYPTLATGRLGIRRLSAAAASTDGEVIHSGNAGALYLGAGKFVFRAAVMITTLSDGTDRAIYRVGGGDAVTFADNTDGVYLECDLAGNASNNWFLCTATNGTRTRTDTGIAPVAGAFQNVEVRVNAATDTVTAEIDGVAGAAAVTTNIPLTPGRAMAPMHAQILKSLGATSRSIDIDWLQYYQVFTASRGS
jgi:hypothetical protein